MQPMLRFLAPIIVGVVVAIAATQWKAVFSRDEPALMWKPLPTSSSNISDLDAGCGPVSLAVVARLLDRPGRIEEFAALAAADGLGRTSLADLRIALERWGLSAVGLNTLPDGPLPHELPLILHLRGNHFAVAIPVTPTAFVFIDPPNTPVVRSIEELSPIWEGNCLVVAKSEEDLGELFKQKSE